MKATALDALEAALVVAASVGLVALVLLMASMVMR